MEPVEDRHDAVALELRRRGADGDDPVAVGMEISEVHVGRDRAQLLGEPAEIPLAFAVTDTEMNVLS
jgi:hypothetical protein